MRTRIRICATRVERTNHALSTKVNVLFIRFSIGRREYRQKKTTTKNKRFWETSVLRENSYGRVHMYGEA